MTISRRAHNKLPDGVAAKNHLFSTYRLNAKKRKIEFLISKSEFDLITSGNCHYCNALPLKKFPTDTVVAIKLLEKKIITQCQYNGVDRLNSSLPYIKSNCVPCCEQCNYMKRSYTEQEFLVKILQICNHRFKP